MTASRTFPTASRVDIQTALNDFFASKSTVSLFGVHSLMGHESTTLAQLLTPSPIPTDIGPLQHDEIDIGEPEPIRCLKNGLWLASEGFMPYAVLMGPAMQHGCPAGVVVEIAMASGEAGLEFSQGFFRQLEIGVNAGRAYRGRVISLEQEQRFSGFGGTVKVHRLHKVTRDQVILPQKTLALLERNIHKFVGIRDQIRSRDFSAKKGLLFYGPPGTGKTHTIHYLASELVGHTTLLVTAEQLVLLGEYFRLARFLQPSVMIIEDVDLIARSRDHVGNPLQEVLLNKLLNEMDGLREDAEVIFILTTNRPDNLEAALTARPGRIDQAIEFPLPDEDGRAKLIRLYSRGLEIDDDVVSATVSKTKGTSAAFIKELMRRAAQFHFETSGDGRFHSSSIDSALEEMVFTGGALNLKLLGGTGTELVGMRGAFVVSSN
ncbi:MAG TPA: ATP-binding protein [Terriglobales bacterium]|nr:ATP-binding protein [Terriglobales bacterium]